MLNPNDEQIIEDAVNALFTSIQNDVDPKNEFDLGSWASMAFCDRSKDLQQLKTITSRILISHAAAVYQFRNEK
jgi:hypothetical protein